MKHYHDENGFNCYQAPPALETEFYKNFPNNAGAKRRERDRGHWVSKAFDVILDAECMQLATHASEPSNDILTRIFNDYRDNDFLIADFPLAVLDLVLKCQSERAFEDEGGKCTMPTPKKSALPRAALRKALNDAMDGINPLVVNTLAVASPEYRKQRAAEAFAAGEYNLALVLTAWAAIPPDDPPVP